MKINYSYSFALALFLIFSSLSAHSQEKRWVAKIGSGTVGGSVDVYINGELANPEPVSYDAKIGYQIGITRYFKEERWRGTRPFITAQYANYGFKIENLNYNLHYADVDISVLNRFGNRGQFYYGLGLGVAFLVSHDTNSLINISNKFDVRGNAFVGATINKSIRIYLQGKIGVINLDKETETKNYMFTLNTEFLLF
ncbi:hypothetical protein [Zunongwangia sp.]|uniref:hypothetical protein n=1 Tax=Zunongwangia sp. TaxID=1965325 RepID=UPI003AA80EFE